MSCDLCLSDWGKLSIGSMSTIPYGPVLLLALFFPPPSLCLSFQARDWIILACNKGSVSVEWDRARQHEGRCRVLWEITVCVWRTQVILTGSSILQRQINPHLCCCVNSVCFWELKDMFLILNNFPLSNLFPFLSLCLWGGLYLTFIMWNLLNSGLYLFALLLSVSLLSVWCLYQSLLWVRVCVYQQRCGPL